MTPTARRDISAHRLRLSRARQECLRRASHGREELRRLRLALLGREG